MVYWSRNRNAFREKGATSSHTQENACEGLTGELHALIGVEDLLRSIAL